MVEKNGNIYRVPGLEEFNSVKTSRLSKAIYKFNAIPIKTTVSEYEWGWAAESGHQPTRSTWFNSLQYGLPYRSFSDVKKSLYSSHIP